ncbi:Uncharacterised protein [Mycobacteroides abscessus subsp. abscessus]|nr:Uncharacterised protein [Mycobacteroides abscessus subsp. abscessus]SKX74488.1 Uncharacterised protein [Mycobacteroides abscessus subsp. abscessus]
MSAKQVIPVAPGIFINGGPLVALLFDPDTDSWADRVLPLIVAPTGAVGLAESGGNAQVAWSGPWNVNSPNARS